MTTTSAIDLRCGRWQDALADVEQVDALITDPPYSERTHAGMRIGDVVNGAGNDKVRDGVVYSDWTPDDVETFVSAWSPRVRGWFVAITDHVLWPTFATSLSNVGRYVFQPLPFLEMGKQPRLTGDGPASWTCWIVVARPSCKPYSAWGSLPGGYVPPTSVKSHRSRVIKGGKPLWLMQSLVRDYSRRGDLICDPCAGGATTLLAAAIESRRAVGAEESRATYALACKRIARGYTPSMFTSASAPPAEQQGIEFKP